MIRSLHEKMQKDTLPFVRANLKKRSVEWKDRFFRPLMMRMRAFRQL